MEKKLELLAPAGSVESLKAAVSAGADAVYMGGSRFGARAYADNPKGDALLEAIDYAHLYGVRLYLTVNTLLKEPELQRELYAYLLPCYEHGLDAVIVQDLGVLQAVREWFPELPVHASTQMTLYGGRSVKLLERLGVRRVVLPRELSLEEIREIHQTSKAEIECFVHGALCYCYSGQCLFSSILGGRSGNRGRCAQPCRLSYEAFAGGRRLSPKGGQPLLSPKDLCALDLIPEIAQAGVSSLKIEGRMKRPEYTAGVVRIYRKYVDRYLNFGGKDYHVSEEDRKELLLLFNRDGFSRGYYEKHNGKELMALLGKKPADQEKGAYEQRIAALKQEYVETERKIPVTGVLYAEAGQPMRLELSADGGRACLSVYGECPQVPKNRPMEEEQLYRQLQKTGNTPFQWKELQIQAKGPLFVPVQALNQLRRDACEKLEKELMFAYCRSAPAPKSETKVQEKEKVRSKKNRPELHISVETEEQLDAVLSMTEQLKDCGDGLSLQTVYVDAEQMEADLPKQLCRIREKRLDAWVMLPAVFRKRTAARYEKNKDFWTALPADGFVIRNLEEHMFFLDAGWKGEQILDHNVYTLNSRSIRFWQERGVRYMTSPLELNSRELRAISTPDHIQIIYGRYPMMITAGCLHRTLDRCRHQTEIWTLKDRYQAEFPVRNCCRDCYNVIYNSQPLYLLDQREELLKLGAGAYRILFTTESRREVQTVLKAFLERKKPEDHFTRGHFKRGIE
ncbi:MAG: U32 family peptidase [Lachnospiraceae bacterium]|nr:U32 family peptidase [Lachnospiraceae bacterium]